MANAGGSGDFVVSGRQVPIPPAETDDLAVAGEGAGEGGGGGFAGDALDEQAAGAVIEATAKVLGKALVLATKIPDADFSPDEVEALRKLWIPVMPHMSPLSAAIVGTVVIVGGKFALIMVEKGKAKGDIPQAGDTEALQSAS